MTTSWLHGYIISSIYRVFTREREMASLGIASGELKSRLNLQLRRSFSAACSSLVTPSWPLTCHFPRLST